MKVDMTITEVKKGRKVCSKLIKADQKIKKVSPIAKAVCSSYNNWFVVSKSGIDVYPSKEGYIDGKLLRELEKNYEIIMKYARKFDCKNQFEIDANQSSKLRAIVWVMENWTSNWSSSPYSDSFYDSKNINWHHKPEGSLRVSDHWNFNTYDELGEGITDGRHCPTKNKNFKSRWAVGQFSNGAYKIIKTF
ncbi:hypothetical protein [Streptococcus ruminantium]|uniref:hypothetical protein n=1 Tax=Streptococcus ruminantium TaxID=1917441 RepID=UPI0012DE2C1B|nr:hypothetical protein [Streptococcus ruminantium]